ncbi:MAG: hypothetical protein M3340_13535 [Actinomycetota bacterium]|nr:hypothetical protein [Actinomycetota bacterium]
MYASVALHDARVATPLATLSSIIPHAILERDVTADGFTIEARATLDFSPAAPTALGQVFLTACFRTEGTETPFSGAIATWAYAELTGLR